MTGASTGPLADLRVVELASIGPGPFAAMLLADLGADVLRIDRPAGSGGASAIPAELDVLRRNRRSAVLDLSKRAGVGAVLDLVASADILMEGNRPGVAERLGLTPEACWERNPRLIYARMTGWGQEGPLAPTAGHDLTYLARTGLLHAIGRRGEAPGIPLNLVGDFGGGSLYLVLGMLAAVHEVSRSGRGQVVDAAIVDGAVSMSSLFHSMLNANLWRDQRGVNLLDGGVPWYDVYETSDGRHVAVGAIEAKFYVQLMTKLGLDPDEARRHDESQYAALRAEIAQAFRQRSRDEWTACFAESDACVAPVLSLLEAPHDDHLAARGTFVKVDDQVQPAPAPRFSRTSPGTPRAARGAGADTREVLTAWGVRNVDDLIEQGVAVQAHRT